MTTLHFGVIDLPYGKQGKMVVTTGDVATILEAKYGVMQAFFDRHKQDIATMMERGILILLESAIMGEPQPPRPFAEMESGIAKLWRDFLDSAEIEAMGIPGVPTQAALDGVSHRFKDVYNTARFKKGPRAGQRKRPRRPSFIDTGQYEASFRVEIS